MPLKSAAPGPSLLFVSRLEIRHVPPTPLNRSLIDAIGASLHAHADPRRALGQQAYMKAALPFLGVPVPVVRRLTHAACKSHPCGTFAQYRRTVEALFFSAEYQEQRYAAVGLCTFPGHADFQTSSALPLYRKLIVHSAWWDIVDELSQRVGLLLKRSPLKMKAALLQWAHHDDIWLRRAAIICQRGFRQDTDVSLLFACIEPSVDRPEFFLRKGIGWALRDLARTNPTAVRRYVATNHARLSALTKREALKHLGEPKG